MEKKLESKNEKIKEKEKKQERQEKEKQEKETKEEKNESKKYLYILAMLFIIVFFILLSGFILRLGCINGWPQKILYVTENDVDWNLLEELNIFDIKSKYNRDVIAPGDKGVYSFLVKNQNEDQIIYDLQLREVNNYNLNMKYRLKLDNIYVCGDENTYLPIDEVGLESVIVQGDSTNKYTLEWIWEDDDENDTRIGELDYASYTLRLKIGAQLYDKE